MSIVGSAALAPAIPQACSHWETVSDRAPAKGTQKPGAAVIMRRPFNMAYFRMKPGVRRASRGARFPLLEPAECRTEAGGVGRPCNPQAELRMTHAEPHKSHRVGWLRAAVLGANDGIVSTASLIIGVAAASTTHEAGLLAGVAGLVAGAMSMAAGEYVSVSSQADVERADIAREKAELKRNPEGELLELRQIYMERGLDPLLAQEVAEKLTEADAL